MRLKNVLRYLVFQMVVEISKGGHLKGQKKIYWQKLQRVAYYVTNVMKMRLQRTKHFKIPHGGFEPPAKAHKTFVLTRLN